ncbi:MAG TPA: sigma-70 family RNA polymerase sigma factor [Isosphaeraceae bacterium]|jgi:RNA polymerase sigma-70 factor (ECF subfamily)|nr:sigma-70 family RNA polymerase sigma factor [Isosphaeraceae bacterium]
MEVTPSTRASLLVRLRDPRDEPAWDEFVAIYTPLVYRVARRRGLQDADANDLVQDVLRAVAGAIGRWDPDPERGSFRAWLFHIARNLTVNFLTRQANHPRGTGDSAVREALEDRPAPAGPESALVDAEYRRQRLAWAAERVRGEFGDLTWRAFWQAGVEGKPAREVAEALGLTVGTVYQYKSRVVARLRRELQAAEDETRNP